MKVKTSITLSEEVIAAVDRLAEVSGNRSGVIETAVRRYLAQVKRDEQDRRDLEVINTHAGRLNREAEDVRTFQGEW